MTKALAGIRPLVASALRMQIKSLPCDPQLLEKKHSACDPRAVVPHCVFMSRWVQQLKHFFFFFKACTHLHPNARRIQTNTLAKVPGCQTSRDAAWCYFNILTVCFFFPPLPECRDRCCTTIHLPLCMQECRADKIKVLFQSCIIPKQQDFEGSRLPRSLRLVPKPTTSFTATLVLASLCQRQRQRGLFSFNLFRESEGCRRF